MIKNSKADDRCFECGKKFSPYKLNFLKFTGFLKEVAVFICDGCQGGDDAKKESN